MFLNYMYVSVLWCVMSANALGQKVLDPPQLESWVVVSHQHGYWKPWSSHLQEQQELITPKSSLYHLDRSSSLVPTTY